MSLRKIHRSALVRFTPVQMFDLVIEVERYPEFLPWVVGAVMHERHEGWLRASMEMQKAGVRERFTTRNEMVRPDWMSMTLVEGPFRVLDGLWKFTPIGDSGTRIELEMKFEFANPVVGLLFGKSFEQSCDHLIDAFIARAKQVYAAASAGPGDAAPASHPDPAAGHGVSQG